MSGSTKQPPKHQDTTKDIHQDDVPCSSKKTTAGECIMISEEKEADRQPVAAASIVKKPEIETVIDLTSSDKDVAIVTRKKGQEKQKEIPHTKKTLSSTTQPTSSACSRRERPKQKAQTALPKKDDQTKPQRR